MAQTNKFNSNSGGEFRHQTTVGKNGEVLYDAPIEIRDKADMDNYGITKEDCRYLHFGGSRKMRVYFFKTTNRMFAEEQWKYIDNLHSKGYLATRCMVPGKRKAFIRCRDTNKCLACPYGMTPEIRQAAVISWDGLIDAGCETTATDSVEGQVIAKTTYEELRDRMNEEDPRITQAFEAKALFGASVKKIARDLGVSEPRVYQLIARAKEIGKEYKKKEL